jgi:hypothetical protein
MKSFFADAVVLKISLSATIHISQTISAANDSDLVKYFYKEIFDSYSC